MGSLIVACFGWMVSMGKGAPVVVGIEGKLNAAAQAARYQLYQGVEAATSPLLLAFSPQLSEDRIPELDKFLNQPWTQDTADTDETLREMPESSSYEARMSSPSKVGDNVSRAISLLDDYAMGFGYGSITESGKRAARNSLVKFAMHTKRPRPDQASALLFGLVAHPDEYHADGVASGAAMDKILVSNPLAAEPAFFSQLLQFDKVPASSPARPSSSQVVLAINQHIQVSQVRGRSQNAPGHIERAEKTVGWAVKYFDQLASVPGSTDDQTRKATAIASHLRSVQGTLGKGRYPDEAVLLKGVAISNPERNF